MSDKFAGMKGPCPNCKVIIEIPKEKVVVHAPEEFVSGGKTVRGRAILKPISRMQLNCSAQQLLFLGLGCLGVLVVTTILGFLSLNPFVLNIIGVLGLFAVSFPVVLFVYQLLREEETLEVFEGTALYSRAGICCAAYSILWISFEFLIKYLGAGPITVWAYLLPFIFLAVLVVHAVFDFDLTRGLLHYFAFLGTIIILRGLLGLGWIWSLAQPVVPGGGSAPPPPGLG
ncbi:MAG: hypothetical protein ACRC10_11675 [Thermoguttaceae bacterium]